MAAGKEQNSGWVWFCRTPIPPLGRYWMVVSGARRTRSSKASLATCEFEACLGYEPLSQKAENGVGGRVGGWEEEEEEENEKRTQASSHFCLI